MYKNFFCKRKVRFIFCEFSFAVRVQSLLTLCIRSCSSIYLDFFLIRTHFGPPRRARPWHHSKKDVWKNSRLCFLTWFNLKQKAGSEFEAQIVFLLVSGGVWTRQLTAGLWEQSTSCEPGWKSLGKVGLKAVGTVGTVGTAGTAGHPPVRKRCTEASSYVRLNLKRLLKAQRSEWGSIQWVIETMRVHLHSGQSCSKAMKEFRPWPQDPRTPGKGHHELH